MVLQLYRLSHPGEIIFSLSNMNAFDLAFMPSMCKGHRREREKLQHKREELESPLREG